MQQQQKKLKLYSRSVLALEKPLPNPSSCTPTSLHYRQPKEQSWTLLTKTHTTPQSLVTIFLCLFDGHVGNK